MGRERYAEWTERKAPERDRTELRQRQESARRSLRGPSNSRKNTPCPVGVDAAQSVTHPALLDDPTHAVGDVEQFFSRAGFQLRHFDIGPGEWFGTISLDDARPQPAATRGNARSAAWIWLSG